ncbi:hypothetical protein EOL94_00350 [bacterium]|nr:hypothetical protein [bacterium]
MTIEKWKDILGRVKDGFEVEDEGRDHIEDEGGVDVEYIIFKSPQGRFRLEFVSKPVVLDKKTMFSKRIGSETKVEYVYSDEEKMNRMIAYKFLEDDEAWEEMDPKIFS